MKNIFALLFFGLIGGIAGTYLTLSFAGNFYGNLITAGTEAQPSPVPVISTPPPGMWQKVVYDVSQKTVAIQVFQNNKIVRQGSGIMVSSDGLAVTVSDLSVTGAVYQVFYEDKIVKGVPVSVDYNLNLMLLKTDAPASGIVDLKENSYASGREIALIGKIVSLSKPAIFSQPGWISLVTDRVVAIDSSYNSSLIGTVAADLSGNILGINRIRSGKIDLISNSAIAGFLKQYLEKKAGN